MNTLIDLFAGIGAACVLVALSLLLWFLHWTKEMDKRLHQGRGDTHDCISPKTTTMHTTTATLDELDAAAVVKEAQRIMKLL